MSRLMTGNINQGSERPHVNGLIEEVRKVGVIVIGVTADRAINATPCPLE